MAINFPDSPSVNDTYTVGDRTWVWDGTTWTVIVGGVPTSISEFSVTGDLNVGQDAEIDGILTANHIHGNIAGSVYLHVKNTSGSEIAAGTPVYATGSVGASGATEVSPSDASTAGTMPAIGITQSTLAINAEGHATVLGVIGSLDTSTYGLNDSLYVAPGGGLTDTRPTALTDLVQKIGRVVRVDGSTGEILVLGAGRSNDVPNNVVAGGLTIDTDTLHVDATNNRVGIGTTSPAHKLDVAGDIHISNSTPYLIFTDTDTNAESRISANSGLGSMLIEADYNDEQADTNIIFKSDGSERMRIDSSGRVGIGTTSPAADLHIADTSTALHLQDTDGTVGGSMSSMIQFTDSTGAVQSQVGLGTGTGFFLVDNNDGPMRVGTASADSLYLRTNNANRLTIDSSGNVGIGDDTPSYKLDVNGTIRATGAIYNNSVVTSNATSTRDKLRVWDSSFYTIGMQSGITFGPLNDYAMTFQMNNDSDRGFWWGDNAHGVNQGAMALSTNGNLYVANSIKVNFGETNTSQTYNYAVEANGGFYSNSSYVSRPGPSATGFYINPQLPNTGGGRAMDIRACSDSSSAPFQFLTGNSFAFVTDGATRLTIDNGGISKSGGSFDIQHPLEPTDSTSRLRHGFLEGPYNDNVYRGTAVLDSSGEASIDLDTHFGMREGTWLALNTNPWVMAAVNGGASVTWALNGKILTLTGNAGDSVQWIVIGERHDPHMTSDKNTSTDENGRLILEYIREWEDEDGYTPPFLEPDETGG